MKKFLIPPLTVMLLCIVSCLPKPKQSQSAVAQSACELVEMTTSANQIVVSQEIVTEWMKNYSFIPANFRSDEERVLISRARDSLAVELQRFESLSYKDSITYASKGLFFACLARKSIVASMNLWKLQIAQQMSRLEEEIQPDPAENDTASIGFRLAMVGFESLQRRHETLLGFLQDDLTLFSFDEISLASLVADFKKYEAEIGK
jgi:hypothetical protein